MEFGNRILSPESMQIGEFIFFIGRCAFSIHALLARYARQCDFPDNSISPAINNDRRDDDDGDVVARARPSLPKRINWIVLRNLTLSNVYRGLQKKRKQKTDSITCFPLLIVSIR